MSNRIVIEVQPLQTRVALVENGVLAEYYVERPGRERLAGNIYKGRVANVLPGMEAAFVDIGLERNAFLYAGDVALNPEEFEFEGKSSPVGASRPSIRELVRAGQELMVQVTKDPAGSKGARITTHVTLPGRLLVLMPTVDYVGVSRRIEDEDLRAGLKAKIDSLRPQGMGVIVRTVAAEASLEEMADEIASLLEMWDQIQHELHRTTAPACLYRDSDLLMRAVRDMFSDHIDEMVINDAEAYEKARRMAERICPELRSRIRHFTDSADIFDYYSLEEKVDKSFSRKVWLKSGGYLVIDHTEALTAIDVNTGKYVGEKDLQKTLVKTNLEAAQEIAHQVRLRDIGGIIIIDFIDMLQAEHQQQVVAALKEALKSDSTRTNVLGMTSLGLVEMTRKKVRQRVSTILHETCPYCNGSGRVLTAESVALKVLKELRKLRQEDAEGRYMLKAHADVADYLEQGALLDERVEIYRSRSAHIEFFRISPVL
jgi:ribonuclease G